MKYDEAISPWFSTSPVGSGSKEDEIEGISANRAPPSSPTVRSNGALPLHKLVLYCRASIVREFEPCGMIDKPNDGLDNLYMSCTCGNPDVDGSGVGSTWVTTPWDFDGPRLLSLAFAAIGRMGPPY